MSEDIINESTESEIQESPVASKKGRGRPKKTFVASPQQIDDLKQKIKFHESVAQGSISAGEGSLDNREVMGKEGKGRGNFYTKKIDPRPHLIEANKLKHDLERVSPIHYQGKDKDDAYRMAKAIKEKFKDEAPTVDEMNHATGMNVRKNTNWLYKEHNFNGVRMTGDQAQLMYQKIMRSIDPNDSVIEDHRRGR